MTERTYHGWIYIQKTEGYHDHYMVHVTRPDKDPLTISMGSGAGGAASAVAFFEEPSVKVTDNGSFTATYDGLNLGHVNLEQTPLGLRVYTTTETEVAA